MNSLSLCAIWVVLLFGISYYFDIKNYIFYIYLPLDKATIEPYTFGLMEAYVSLLKMKKVSDILIN